MYRAQWGVPGSGLLLVLFHPVIVRHALYLQRSNACRVPFCCVVADVCAELPVTCPSSTFLIPMPGALCLLVLLILAHPAPCTSSVYAYFLQEGLSLSDSIPGRKVLKPLPG